MKERLEVVGRPTGSPAGGWYYQLTDGVSVKYSKAGTFVCMTDHTADTCPHSRCVMAHCARHGLPPLSPRDRERDRAERARRRAGG